MQAYTLVMKYIRKEKIYFAIAVSLNVPAKK